MFYVYQQRVGKKGRDGILKIYKIYAGFNSHKRTQINIYMAGMNKIRITSLLHFETALLN